MEERSFSANKFHILGNFKMVTGKSDWLTDKERRVDPLDRRGNVDADDARHTRHAAALEKLILIVQ